MNNPEHMEWIQQWEPLVGEEEKAELIRTIDSGWIIEAQRTWQFERIFADYMGTKYAVATTSGTISLLLALMAVEVEPGDEVIIPDFTFIATANAVRMTGARPVLVDVKLNDITIMESEIESKITPKTKAIVPVHINGRPADMSSIRKIASQHGLWVIEDAAQAIGSRLNGQLLGTFGDLGCFSLATTKIITAGQGGIVLTNSEELYHRLIRLKDHGRLKRSWNYHPAFGLNFKFTDLQAAVGLAQFPKLENRLSRMKETFSVYRENLSDLPGVRFWDLDLAGGVSPWFVDGQFERRDELQAFLKEHRVRAREFYPPIHTQECYLHDGSFPNTETASKVGLWLPSSVFLTHDQILRVCSLIHQFYEGSDCLT
jgi:perosamine synthetase